MKKTSKYIGVSQPANSKSSGTRYWECNYRGQKSYFKNERDAALAYDKMRIKDGKEPVNILKRVK